ncbi:MAG: HlyD family type I secretion periplasmic adaptor subunit [Methylotenera sp.]|nr:HlyD family type I secretion periplasmic adaptor subunit [Methylotenera sp.]
MSQGLFKFLGNVQAFYTRRNWLTKPINHLLEKLVSNKTSEDIPWDEEADMMLIEQSPRRAKKLLYWIAIILFGLIIWGYFAEVDEVTRGEGRVIPSKQLQIIQSLDGGIVTEILVKEGDTVAQGTPLIRIDETRAVSSLRENQSQYMSLLVKEARLQALATGGAFTPPPEVQKQEPELYAQEYALYQSSKEELASSISISRDQMEQREKELAEVQFKKELAEKTYDSTSKELAANKPLLASGAVSEIDILKLEREVNRAKGDIDQSRAQLSRIQSAISEARRKISEVDQAFRNKVRTELNDTSAKLGSLTETSVALSDKVKQSTLKSPVKGKINKIYYNTIGGVIQPGKEVMELVPLDDALVIETKIEIRDIAFLRPNQPAVVKLTAYDYTVYGTLDAMVESISPNSTVDEKGNAYYLVRVRTLKSSLGKGLPIIPGMVAQVDVLTGKKTILSYLLKPVLKAKAHAFTER